MKKKKQKKNHNQIHNKLPRSTESKGKKSRLLSKLEYEGIIVLKSREIMRCINDRCVLLPEDIIKSNGKRRAQIRIYRSDNAGIIIFQILHIRLTEIY